MRRQRFPSRISTHSLSVRSKMSRLRIMSMRSWSWSPKINPFLRLYSRLVDFKIISTKMSVFLFQVITEKTNEPIVNEATSLSASAAYSPAYAHPSSSSPSFSTPRHNTGYQQQPSYAQTTAYGNIPTGWTIDEPVKRVRHQPPLERQLLPKLPFKDFSQT